MYSPVWTSILFMLPIHIWALPLNGDSSHNSESKCDTVDPDFISTLKNKQNYIFNKVKSGYHLNKFKADKDLTKQFTFDKYWNSNFQKYSCHQQLSDTSSTSLGQDPTSLVEISLCQVDILNLKNLMKLEFENIWEETIQYIEQILDRISPELETTRSRSNINSISMSYFYDILEFSCRFEKFIIKIDNLSNQILKNFGQDINQANIDGRGVVIMKTRVLNMLSAMKRFWILPEEEKVANLPLVKLLATSTTQPVTTTKVETTVAPPVLRTESMKLMDRPQPGFRISTGYNNYIPTLRIMNRNAPDSRVQNLGIKVHGPKLDLDTSGYDTVVDNVKYDHLVDETKSESESQETKQYLPLKIHNRMHPGNFIMP